MAYKHKGKKVKIFQFLQFGGDDRKFALAEKNAEKKERQKERREEEKMRREFRRDMRF